MEGAASSPKADDGVLDGPILKARHKYILYQEAMRVDMYRKFGGKEALFKHFTDIHQGQVCRLKYVCTAVNNGPHGNTLRCSTCPLPRKQVWRDGG